MSIFSRDEIQVILKEINSRSSREDFLLYDIQDKLVGWSIGNSVFDNEVLPIMYLDGDSLWSFEEGKLLGRIKNNLVINEKGHTLYRLLYG